ncbi:sirohydrochlorin chelatase [Actinoplanes sp. TRM 88003]|uniref:Sirohydrochlorin chelatase n=1 Tax=Paractinoplanes aksuensis TaxID=2939490 RepID=A0ABT1DTW8_9ACTN|nr:CbiX/SirB N-terminal domain-containing protein [Actinoplanes aksuensis]MCO8274260.1 sirohydrochlorin chelatase [Actinoplanes aksuensis]
MPALIAVAHGTRSPAGQAQIRDLVARVAARRPGLDVRLAYVDVQEPKVAELTRVLPDAVVVPLLLSAGYHVRVDIAEAVAGTSIPVTKPLGPDDVLLAAMMRRLPDADAVVLAAAGSSDPAWRADVEKVASDLDLAGCRRLPRPPGVGVGGGGNPTQRQVNGSELSTGADGPARHPSTGADGPARFPFAGADGPGGYRAPVSVGYVSGPGPRVADLVAGLRQRGARRIAVASYFLADGLFYRSLHKAGADAVTPPLCLDPAVTDLVLRRYESALLTSAERRL